MDIYILKKYIPRHQHCTDEAQKAETVLSAVKKKNIYIYIYLQVDPSLITLYIVYAILILLAGLLQVIFPSRFLN